jgi:hypothetical protein
MFGSRRSILRLPTASLAVAERHAVRVEVADPQNDRMEALHPHGEEPVIRPVCLREATLVSELIGLFHAAIGPDEQQRDSFLARQGLASSRSSAASRSY